MVRLGGEGKGWLVAGAAFAAAWVIALAAARFEIGSVEYPDDFSPAPPLSVLVTVLGLVPATVIFLGAAVSRAAFVGLQSVHHRPATDEAASHPHG